MIFHVYGYANPTQGLFRYLKNCGCDVRIFGEENEDGRYDIRTSLQTPNTNILGNLIKPGYHFFTRFDGQPEVINTILKLHNLLGGNTGINKKIAHISYGWEYFNNLLQKLDFNNFDYVLCCNKKYVQKLKQMGITAYFFPNTIDPYKINFLGYEKGSVYNLLAYSLKFSPAKNYPSLIKFFNQLLERNDKFHLTIRAASTDVKVCMEQETKVKKLIKKFSIENKVTLLTYPLDTDKEWRSSYGDANSLLKNKSLCISYSKWESFGYVLAEAMLAGKQIAVKGWSTPLQPKQFWGDAVCMSKTAMMDKITEYAELPKNQKYQIAVENRKFVEQNYSPEVSGNLLLEILYKD